MHRAALQREEDSLSLSVLSRKINEAFWCVVCYPLDTRAR